MQATVDVNLLNARKLEKNKITNQAMSMSVIKSPQTPYNASDVNHKDEDDVTEVLK